MAAWLRHRPQLLDGCVVAKFFHRQSQVLIKNRPPSFTLAVVGKIGLDQGQRTGGVRVRVV